MRLNPGLSSNVGAISLIREAVANELIAQNNDRNRSLWRGIEQLKQSNQDQQFASVETPNGTLRLLVGKNGQPLSPDKRRGKMRE